MNTYFSASMSEETDYEATAGWYIASEENLAAPPVTIRSRIQR